MPLTLPVPTTMLQVTWAIIGFMFGRAFGKQLDHDIKQSEWFKKLDPVWRNIVGRALDFLHHFEVGLVMMVYGHHIPEIYWFGYGLVVDDGPDIPRRFAKYFTYLGRA